MTKHSVLARFVLAFLFVINATGHSSARNILGQKWSQNELEVTRMKSIFAQKETSYGSGAPYDHVRKLGLGGKKSMVAHEEYSSMVYSLNEKGSDGRGTSKISVQEDNDALKKSVGSSREEVDQKEDMTMLEQPKASKLTNYVVPRSTASDPFITNSNSQVKVRLSSSTRPERQISEEPKAHEGTSSQKDEQKTKDLFKAEVDIVNLIHKDYMGMARRKPPINNHEPRN